MAGMSYNLVESLSVCVHALKSYATVCCVQHAQNGLVALAGKKNGSTVILCCVKGIYQVRDCSQIHATEEKKLCDGSCGATTKKNKKK